MKGVETGKRKPDAPGEAQDAISVLANLRARGMDAELRKLLRRMQPSGKTDQARLDAVLDRFGISHDDWVSRVEAAAGADNARWIEDNPAFDEILGRMEGDLTRRVSKIDLAEITVDEIADQWAEEPRMAQAIRSAIAPHGREFRDRGLTGEDIIRIALKRAREGRWKEAADD